MYQGGYARLFLLICSLTVFYYVVQIFKPFLLPVALAAVLVSLCFPAFAWIRQRLKGHSGWAAFLTCLGVTALFVLPCIFLLIKLAIQAAQIYQRFQTTLVQGQGMQPFWQQDDSVILSAVMDFLQRYVDLDQMGLVGSLASLLEKLSAFLLQHSTILVTGLVSFLTSFLLMLVTMFFLFRDSDRLARELRNLSPLSDFYQQQIVTTFREVSSATVVGSLVTAMIQGIAGGIVFSLMGVSQALFWGTLTGFLSLVPVFGTALVWIPWAIYFMSAVSSIQALVFVALFALIGLLDNLIRPFFIEGRVKMHSLLVFFSLMGGISYFGMLGLIFGPILVALGLTFLELFKVEFGQKVSD